MGCILRIHYLNIYEKIRVQENNSHIKLTISLAFVTKAQIKQKVDVK